MERAEDTDLWCEECEVWVPARIVWYGFNTFDILSTAEDGQHDGHNLDVR